MNKYFCCFKKKTTDNKNMSYVDYFSTHDTMSNTSITSVLIDAIQPDDDDEIRYSYNPLYKDKHKDKDKDKRKTSTRPS
jgi:hypothetical protein